MQDKELIEQLQPHNLPHMADGSFNITAKQHAAILSLLSQQEVVVESEEEAALKAYPVSPSSFIFNKGKDDEIVQQFDENDDFRAGFVAGSQHARQQLSQQQQQRQYSEEDELLEEMALFIEQVQNSKFYAAMTNEGKQLVYDLLTKYNKLPKQ